MPALTSIGNTMTVRSVLAESAATVKPLVSVNASMTITEVVSVLNRNNVVSAPVSDSMDNGMAALFYFTTPR
jgi:predicted transcriptional regulator